MSKSIRKGDRVLVIAGNDRGKTGEVLWKSKDRILIQDVNVRKKHLKRTQESQGPRVIEKEIPIHISNVSLCDKEGKKIRPKAENMKKAEPKKDAAPKKAAPKKTAKSSVKKAKDV